MSKTDQELLDQHQALSDELQALLIQDGLLAVIQKFGLAAVGGSAALGLLVRRDVDVSVRLKDDMDTATFFAIGAAITKQFLVQKASYSNHFIRNWPGFDHGLYWGIQLKHQGVVWKLDLWGYGAAQFDAHRRRHVLLSQDLGKLERAAILRLKDDLHDGEGYRYRATGPDLYTAMIAGGVRDAAQFEQWWAAHRAH